jgi:hypothetical protein
MPEKQADRLQNQASPMMRHTGSSTMNREQQKEFLQATAWLRPYTRWATAFSIRTSGLLPAALRNLPLKLVQRLLVRQRKRMESGCRTG